MAHTEPQLYKHYHQWKSWSEFFVATPDEVGYFEQEFSDLMIRDADVLEIGFGTGACVAWMAERGARVSVTELSEESCAAARRRGYEVIPAALPSVAEAHRERFHSIIALDVFEHLDLDECRRHLEACATMLRPGGKLLLRFPNAQSPFGLAPQMGDPTHRSFLSSSVLELLIVDLPFELSRYSGSVLFRGRPLTPVWFKRTARRIVQRALSAILNFAYASMIPYEPVVVTVMTKKNPIP